MADDAPAEKDQAHVAQETLDYLSRRVVDNFGNGFAGAFAIIPPSGEPISSLMLDDNASLGLFWGTLKSRIDMALLELQEQERQGNAFGRR